MNRMAVGLCVVMLIGAPGLASGQVLAECSQPGGGALQGLGDAGVPAERIRELMQSVAAEREARRREHVELVSAADSADDLAQLLRDTVPVGAEAASVGDYRELTRLLRRDPPRPRTVEYKMRLDNVLAIQACLGIPRGVLDYTVQTVRESAEQLYPAADIQDYFSLVRSLDVEPPDDSDVRTWRFLARQDVLEQLLLAVTATGGDFAAAVSALASDVEILNPEAADRLYAAADFLQERKQLLPRVFRWAAEGIASPHDFAFDSVPVTVYEFGKYVAEEPVLAAAAAELRQGFRQEPRAFRFMTNAMRVGLQQGTAEIYSKKPESAQAQLVNPEYLREYTRRADGVINQLEQYNSGKERSWRTDPQRRADFMGNRLVQYRLRRQEDVPGLLRDTVREWLDGARIAGSRPVEIRSLPFPQMVLLVDPGAAAERLQAARAAWLRETESDAGEWSEEALLEWFALHGIVVVQAEPEDPLWHAEPYMIAAAGAEQLAFMCDRMLYRSGVSGTFLHIAEVEFAVRMAGLRQFYMHEELTRRLLQHDLRDLASMQRYRALWTYQQELAELLTSLDSRLDDLPRLLPADAPVAYLGGQVSVFAAVSGEKEGVNGPWMQDHEMLLHAIGVVEGGNANR